MAKSFEQIEGSAVLALSGSERGAAPEYAMIDVRSSYEFDQGALVGFINLPILTDQERQQVGTTYRHQGSAAAIELGHALVAPYRQERMASWAEAIRASVSQTGLMLCWRGGMRSETACHWLAESGLKVRQVTGGYKSVRRALIMSFASMPPFWVLAGMTGVGKTEVITQLGGRAIDLEGLAKHRGSTFGAFYQGVQPLQATFENALALQILNFHRALLQRPLVIEDESRVIGRLSLPEPLFLKILTAPVIEMEATLGERSERIFNEYVMRPLNEGMTQEMLESTLLQRLGPLMRRLDRRGVEIRAQMVDAFRLGKVYDDHRAWIESLLVHYYDVRYRYARSRADRPLLFKGPKSAVLEWIATQQVNTDAEKIPT